MFKYITPEDIDHIMYDIMMNYYEEIEGYTVEEIKQAVTEICDIYYSFNMDTEDILEIAKTFIDDWRNNG